MGYQRLPRDAEIAQRRAFDGSGGPQAPAHLRREPEAVESKREKLPHRPLRQQGEKLTRVAVIGDPAGRARRIVHAASPGRRHAAVARKHPQAVGSR